MPELASDPNAIRALAEPFIQAAEGLRLHAYADPASGGEPWTIGYGATGPGILRDTVWTKAQAQTDLDRRLDAALVEVGELVKVPLGNEGYAALLSLEYNIGLGNLRRSTGHGLLGCLNNGLYADAADRFLLYDKAAGHVFEPLEVRRHKERALFLLGVPPEGQP